MTKMININDQEEALFQLALATRRKPAQAGPQGRNGSNAVPTPISLPTIRATPFKPRDPALIPPRLWIYDKHYIRKFLSETVAPGALGKSSLVTTEALAIVTGKPLLDIIPDEQTRVWYWNGEDPMEELERRIAAACLHYDIDPSELEGRLFVDTGRSMKIILAEMTKLGARIAQPVVDQVIATILENKIGVLIIDPFVASHRVTENDNPAIELVASTWAEIADETGCAIELVHHCRKTGGAEITVEDGRGGSALLAKARSARVLNGMSEDEAARAGVEKRRSFFRVDNGKANLAPAGDQAAWRQLIGVEIGNGDSVAAVTKWTWPNAFDGVTVRDLREVQSRIAAGRYRESPQAADWAGHVVASILRLDTGNKAHKAKVTAILKTWIANDMLRVVEAQDEQRRPRKFIEVGAPAND
jgi:AAA domain